MILGRRSLERLVGVHPDLVRVVHKAVDLCTIADKDFTVLEGLRTEDRQRVLVAQGASKTMRSRHLTGHAVDLGAWVDGQVDWHWNLYDELAGIVKDAARAVDVPVEWGGEAFGTFKDGPHFQLPWAVYPV